MINTLEALKSNFKSEYEILFESIIDNEFVITNLDYVLERKQNFSLITRELSFVYYDCTKEALIDGWYETKTIYQCVETNDLICWIGYEMVTGEKEFIINDYFIVELKEIKRIEYIRKGD